MQEKLRTQLSASEKQPQQSPTHGCDPFTNYPPPLISLDLHHNLVLPSKLVFLTVAFTFNIVPFL